MTKIQRFTLFARSSPLFIISAVIGVFTFPVTLFVENPGIFPWFSLGSLVLCGVLYFIASWSEPIEVKEEKKETRYTLPETRMTKEEVYAFILGMKAAAYAVNATIRDLHDSTIAEFEYNNGDIFLFELRGASARCKVVTKESESRIIMKRDHFTPGTNVTFTPDFYKPKKKAKEENKGNNNQNNQNQVKTRNINSLDEADKLVGQTLKERPILGDRVKKLYTVNDLGNNTWEIEEK